MCDHKLLTCSTVSDWSKGFQFGNHFSSINAKSDILNECICYGGVFAQSEANQLLWVKQPALTNFQANLLNFVSIGVGGSRGYDLYLQ